MLRRINGLETEYGLSCVRSDGRRAMEPEQAAQLLFQPIVAWGRSSNVFLTNGSRLYVDVGSHPEYASAECDSPRQLVTYDQAGDVVLADLVRAANATFAKDGTDARIHLFKNNMDSAGNGFGSHENYLVERRGEFTRLPHALLPFLITRQIVTGAGAILDGAFAFSNRADQLWESVSSATTRSRPIINTRDEPHGDSTRWRRLHVISGDSSMSEYSAWLKFGMTNLVLGLIETGRPVPDTAFAEPMRAIRSISRDLTVSEPLALEDGRSTTALAVQRAYLEACTALVEAEPEQLADSTAILALWADALDALETGDTSRVETRLDWAIKRRLLEGVAVSKGLPLDSPQIHRLDLAYHDVSARTNLFSSLVSAGRAERLTTEEEVLEAARIAPGTTRAHARGRFITAASRAGLEFAADWTTVRIVGRHARPLTMLDPLDPAPDDVIALSEAIEAGYAGDDGPAAV